MARRLRSALDAGDILRLGCLTSISVGKWLSWESIAFALRGSGVQISSSPPPMKKIRAVRFTKTYGPVSFQGLTHPGTCRQSVSDAGFRQCKVWFWVWLLCWQALHLPPYCTHRAAAGKKVRIRLPMPPLPGSEERAELRYPWRQRLRLRPSDLQSADPEAGPGALCRAEWP